MARIITMVFFLIFYTAIHLEGFALNRNKRASTLTDQQVHDTIQLMGRLNFDPTHVPDATVPRTFACFFVFDKDSSDALNNNLQLGNEYANKLAALASQYTAHANIIVLNAGVEMWSNGDQISFDADATIDVLLTHFQEYLAKTQSQQFGKVYTVGILSVQKPSLFLPRGYTQGPPNTTSSASIITYRPSPWSNAGLVAHELAHTLSVVHPDELQYLCEDCPRLPFCPSSTSLPIPDECLCSTSTFPPQQCLMTYSFGAATPNAPKYTSCDIKTMNFYASNYTCQ
ncbi:unnamed protein product [Adineta steineri]|uniref:Peptidase M12B domain-containing protein n=1 Tax=Adineta steineri TaxID=433720 RepID=A0A815KBA5_9BILA|nr:unnamed protein product [Adineta steineri]